MNNNQLELPSERDTQEEVTNQPKTWDIGDFILFLLVYYLSQIIFYSFFTAFVPKPTGLTRLYFNVIITLMANTLIIVLILIRGRATHGFTWKELGFQGVPWREVLRWTITFFALVFAFNFLYGAILKWYGLGRPNQEVAKFFSASNPWHFKTLALIMVVVSAPLAEEMMYRSVLFSTARNYLPPIIAAIPAGLIFGALHFETLTIIPLGFLGFLLCYIFHQTKSLWLCIGLHTANNTLAYFWLMYFQELFS